MPLFMVEGTAGTPPIDDRESLKEIYLIVRPEEKYDVERALRSVIAPIYCSFAALGRGAQGGLVYETKRTWRRWFGQSHRSTLLPKTIFYFIVPESRVDAVMEVVGAAMRVKCGPSDCGLGVGIVLPIESEESIGVSARSLNGHAPAMEEVEMEHSNGASEGRVHCEILS